MTIPTPRAALKQLLARLDETTDMDGPAPAWMDSYCTAVQALKAEPEGEGRSCAGLLPVEPPNIPTTMAMQYRSAWREGVEDGWNEARTILAGLERPTPPAPEPGEQPLSSLMAQELAEAEQKHGRFDTSETIERLGRCHSAMSTRGDVQSAALCQHAATLLQQQSTELAALREERFVAGQNRINQLWVDALNPSTQVPLSAPQIKKLQKVLDDHCDQGPPNGTMWQSQELEELMWAVEGWVSAATPLPAPQAGEVDA